MSDWLSILAGLVLLLGAAEFLVRGSVWIALALGLTPMTVGLTLVAFGTSAPELFVSVTAALEDAPGIATGNVLGSNVANIALILGLAAVLRPIDHTPRTARFECRFLVFASAFLLLPLAMGTPLGLVHGVILLTSLVTFTAMLVLREKQSRHARLAVEHTDPTPVRDRSARQVVLHVAFVVGGLLGLMYGGEILVRGASGVARALGMTETVIGLTIIAVGTSLPELATSAVAARKGHPEIALGNVLGSNVFNVGMVLGATSAISPLPMGWRSEGLSVVLGLVLAIALAALLRRGGVGRSAGIALLATYAGYVAWSVAQPAG